MKNKYLDNDKLIGDDVEWCDYPYIGIGSKPKKKNSPTEDDLERIIGG